LLGFLPQLDAGAWERPTVCTGWSVKDVASHLVDNELAFGRIYRGEAVDASELDNDAAVERWRRADGETVRFSLWHHGSATQRVMDNRPDESWRRAVPKFGAGLELRHLLRLHFYELAVHAHDLTDAAGAPQVWEDRVPYLVEYCVRNAPYALRDHKGEGTLAVRVPDVGAWTVAGDGAAWTVTAGEEGSVKASIETDAETLVMVTAGRLPVPDALTRAKVEGDEAFVEPTLAAWQLA
jgi:uncharacterized protein (TIGR03083 family)